jgi:protein-disulfide isomerase
MASVAQRAKNTLETLSTVLVIGSASALLWTLFVKQPSSASAALPPVQDVKEETIAKDHLTNVIGNGPIAMVEFTDFQCPYCAKHSQETLPSLKKKLIDSGKVRYIVVSLPLDMHPQAVPAAEAAECAAEQGKYWEMHDLLFAKQKELATADYEAYARGLGLDSKRFASCLAADTALAKVKADSGLAKRLAAEITPTLFLGRMRADGGVDLLKRINGAVALRTILEEAARL